MTTNYFLIKVPGKEYGGSRAHLHQRIGNDFFFLALEDEAGWKFLEEEGAHLEHMGGWRPPDKWAISNDEAAMILFQCKGTRPKVVR